MGYPRLEVASRYPLEKAAPGVVSTLRRNGIVVIIKPLVRLEVAPTGYRSYFLYANCVLPLFVGVFGFLAFDFSIFHFLLTLCTERIARYVAESPRYALYIRGREHYLLLAHYPSAFWLFLVF